MLDTVKRPFKNHRKRFETKHLFNDLHFNNPKGNRFQKLLTPKKNHILCILSIIPTQSDT